MSVQNDDRNMWLRTALRLVLLMCAVTAVVVWVPFIWKILGPFLVALIIAAALLLTGAAVFTVIYLIERHKNKMRNE